MARIKPRDMLENDLFLGYTACILKGSSKGESIVSCHDDDNIGKYDIITGNKRGDVIQRFERVTKKEAIKILSQYVLSF